MGKSFLIKHVVEQATAKLNCRVIVHDLEAVARRWLITTFTYEYTMLHLFTKAYTLLLRSINIVNCRSIAVSSTATAHSEQQHIL